MEPKCTFWIIGVLYFCARSFTVRAQIAPACTEYVRTYHAQSSVSYGTGNVNCGGWNRRQVSYQYPKTSCSLDYSLSTKSICCSGYYSDSSGMCWPICNSRCDYGYCAAPERCQCNDGYTMINGACKPVCAHCQNGTCVGPNQCICSKGFERSNAGTCVPKCTGICLNGVCNASGECICAEGYFSSAAIADFDGLGNATLCVPNCDKPCQNGQCVGRNRCQCHDGYQPSVDQFQCEPICTSSECVNGKCIAPNVCRCNEGYRQEGDRCVPFCEPSCHNAACLQPNRCECHEGYMKYENNTFFCTAICDPPCQNGHCLRPNECECNDGYAPTSVSHKCTPFCNPNYIDAANGMCIAPNVLLCNKNYRLEKLYNSDKIGCQLICSPECVNGLCIGDGRCQCLEGYKALDDQPNICVPICDPACEMGQCVAPNECQCHEGHEKNETHLCIPTCDSNLVDCANGRCATVNVCECDEGYIWRVDSEDDYGVKRCYPICDPACINSNCTEPGVCLCWEGYNVSLTASSICEPFCEEGCENGTCIAPGECKCFEGYHRATSRSDCTAYCDPKTVDCEVGGTCIGPNECECSEGYTLDTAALPTRCVPHCSFLPKNAECTQPDEYRCHVGFEAVYELALLKDCVPVCEQDCGNGTCAAPNECTCFEGYTAKSNESCISICEQSCEDQSGVCVENLCECSEGYSNLINAYACWPVCERCEHGECILPGECICFNGYEMNNETSVCEPLCSNCTEGTYCKVPEECACYGDNIMFIDEENNVHCLSPAETILEPHTNDALVVWLAIIGTTGGIAMLIGMAYVMYKRSTGTYNATVKMSDIKLMD